MSSSLKFERRKNKACLANDKNFTFFGPTPL